MYPSTINLLLLLYFTYISPVTQMVKRKRGGHRQKTMKMPSYTISDEELTKVVHDFLDPPAGMVGLGVSVPSSTTSQQLALSQNKDANEDTVTNSSHGFDDTVTDEKKASDGIKVETDQNTLCEMGTESRPEKGSGPPFVRSSSHPDISDKATNTHNDKTSQVTEPSPGNSSQQNLAKLFSVLSHTSTDKQTQDKTFDPLRSSNTTSPSTEVTSNAQSTKDVQPPNNTSNQDPTSETPAMPSHPITHSTHESTLNARLAAYKNIYEARLAAHAAHAATLDTQLSAHKTALDARLTAHENNLNTTLATHLATMQTSLRNDTGIAFQLLEHNLLHNLHVVPTSYLDALPRRTDVRNDYKDLVSHVNEALDRGTRLVQSAVVETLHEEMRMLRMGGAGKERVGERLGLQELFGEVREGVGREEMRSLETVGAVPEEQGDGPDFVVLGLFVLGLFLLWLWSPRG